MKRVFFATLYPISDEVKEDFVSKYGEAGFIHLADANPELFKEFSYIDPMMDINHIKALAAAIVRCAVELNATHFVSAGEQSICFFCNLYAGTSFFGGLVKPECDCGTAHNADAKNNFSLGVLQPIAVKRTKRVKGKKVETWVHIGLREWNKSAVLNDRIAEDNKTMRIW